MRRVKDCFGFDAGCVLHFIGIGGIGMSALAQIAHDTGCKVQGSDVALSSNVKRLIAKGIPVVIGHHESNAVDADIVMHSGAICSGNPELRAAILANKTVLHRAELLSRYLRSRRVIAISGSHGKTTTTGMISSILEHAGMDPTVIIGGVARHYGNNYKLGKGAWVVVEADESDSSMPGFPPCEVVVVTNLDREHLDYHGDLCALENFFRDFLSRISAGGAAVLPEGLRHIMPQSPDVHQVVFGLHLGDMLAHNIRKDSSGVTFSISQVLDKTSSVCGDVKLSVLGEHNVWNALAAVAVARYLKIPFENIVAGLYGFEGIKRRFEIIANVGGVRFVDDYAHHPTEIKATRKSASLLTRGKVIGILQPHRFTRLQSFFEDFLEAISEFDFMIITDVYSAGEAVIHGCGSTDLVGAAEKRGLCVVYESDCNSIANHITAIAREGDVVVAMGAGDITDMVRSIASLYAHVVA